MLPKDFNYNSREWHAIRKTLENRLETAVGQLCNLECEPTKADQLRGRISFIKDILAGEPAALRDQLQGGNLNDN